MTLAVRAGMDFITALDQGSIGRLRRACAPGATWWVDAGPDRAGGDPTSARGSGRFPLHGVMRLEEKLAMMRELGPRSFPTGCRQVPRRVIAGDRECVIEVEGHGVHANGKVYENRYGFVFDVDHDGLISSIREYLDTIHAQDVVGEGTEFPPRVSLIGGDRRAPLTPSAPVTSEAGRALALWPALAAGDVDGFASQFAPDASFWTDSGRVRERGRLDGRGDVRSNGPFHGRVPVADKIALIHERLQSADYSSRSITVTPHRLIADGALVAIEASGEGEFAGTRYQNRYLWVIDVGAEGIVEVREYCDTLHIAELMGFPNEYEG